MTGEIGLAMVGAGLGLGLRHGIDWDHIAAIADVTASQRSRVRSIIMGTLYAAGHAAVVVALGLIAIWAGSTLPEGLDPIMERVVGVTLVAMGLWITWSLIVNRGNLVLRSRWMLVAQVAATAFRSVRSRLTGRPVEKAGPRGSYGAASSATIGMIHGIGAETGTQALLLASAAGATSAASGSFLLAAFAVGLLVSNLLLTLGSTFGWIGSTSRRAVNIAVGAVFAAFSLTVGFIFLFQISDLLPGFFL